MSYEKILYWVCSLVIFAILSIGYYKTKSTVILILLILSVVGLIFSVLRLLMK